MLRSIMIYANKEEALEAAATMALDGKLATPDEVDAMLAVGVNYQSVYNILKEQFYDNEDCDA